MAGGNNKSFLSNPIEFIRTHHFIVSPQGHGAKKLHCGIIKIDLVSVDEHIREVIQLENFSMRPHGYGARPVIAWFLPAKADDISTLEIDSQCDYMFTSDLSGCLFVAYGEKADEPITIQHVNARSGGNSRILDHIKTISTANHNFCKILSPLRITVLGRADITVYPESINTCVVGVRQGGKWRFYYKPSINVVDEL